MQGEVISRDSVRSIEAVERDAWIDMFAAAPPDVATALGLECRRIDDGALMICRGVDHIQFNRLGGVGIATPARAEALDAAIAAFDAAGVKNWIVHVAAGATGLAALCAQRNLTPHPRTWAKFVREPGRPSQSTALSIREVAGDQAAAFGGTAARGFGMPPIMGRWLAALPGRPNWRCYVAFDNGEPVAAGALYVDGATAWLGVGATLPSHRGRGAQSAILAARITAASDAGCTLLTTETGIPLPGEPAPSYHNILRAGFRVAYPRPNMRRG